MFQFIGGSDERNKKSCFSVFLYAPSYIQTVFLVYDMKLWGWGLLIVCNLPCSLQPAKESAPWVSLIPNPSGLTKYMLKAAAGQNSLTGCEPFYQLQNIELISFKFILKIFEFSTTYSIENIENNWIFLFYERACHVLWNIKYI